MPSTLDKENVKMADCTDCNVFQFCQFLKLLGKVMILLVLLIVGLTYYAVIIATSVPGLYDGSTSMKTWSLFVIITFHCLVGSCYCVSWVPPFWCTSNQLCLLVPSFLAHFQPATSLHRSSCCCGATSLQLPQIQEECHLGGTPLLMKKSVWLNTCRVILTMPAFNLSAANRFDALQPVHAHTCTMDSWHYQVMLL